MARKLGAALGRDWGGAGARHGRTRSQSPPFSAPCTQRRGHRVWCQMLLSRRPNIMAGMQAGDALAAPPQCCGNEGLWGIGHGSPPAPLSRTCGAHRVRRRPTAATGPNTARAAVAVVGGGNYRTFRIAFFRFSHPGFGFSPKEMVKPSLGGESETRARKAIKRWGWVIHIYEL